MRFSEKKQSVIVWFLQKQLRISVFLIRDVTDSLSLAHSLKVTQPLSRTPPYITGGARP